MPRDGDSFDNLFADEPVDTAAEKLPPWKLLLVDDEPDIHQVTRLSLRGFTYEGKPIHILSACSAKEAVDLLDLHPDIAVALIDVVMESADSGLELVRHIRHKRGNRRICIVLRTGQPGYAPELEITRYYPINDYRLKTDLTTERLFALLYSWLRTYENMLIVDNYRQELEKEVENRTRELALTKDKAEAGLEAKRRFLQNISHSFRTPLNSVVGFSDLLARRANLNEEHRGFVAAIRNNAEKIVKMVDSIMQLCRQERGDVQLNPVAFNPRELLQQAAAAHSSALREKHLKLSVLEDASLPDSVVGDQEKLNQVLSELIVNACKFTEAGHIEVRAKTLSRSSERCLLAFEVKDTGCGISEDVRPHVFEELEQLPAHANIQDGLGVGLAMTQRLVQLMGGDILVESALDQGSTFIVKVPLGLESIPRPGVEVHE